MTAAGSRASFEIFENFEPVLCPTRFTDEDKTVDVVPPQGSKTALL